MISRFAQFGRLEKTFAALVLAYVIAMLLPGLSTLAIALQIAVILAGLWLFARYWKRMVAKILWRLRNRLIVAYLLIALVPIILITALVSLAAYMAIGQVSIFLLTSQLDRNTAMLRGAVRLLASAGPNAAIELRKDIPEQIEQRFPGLQIVDVDRNGRRVWPAASTLTPPPGVHPDTDGLVLIGGVLHGWAHITEGERSVTAVFPLTRDYLGDAAPNLGESFIVYKDQGGSPQPANQRRAGTLNRLPPALNRFDREIDWFGLIQAPVWEKPDGPPVDLLMLMRTRPSAVLRLVSPSDLQTQGSTAYMYFLFFAVLFLIAVLIALRVGVTITRTITGAVHDLYQGTLRVRGGDFKHRIPIHGSDQLAELSFSFNDMTGNLDRLLQVEKDRQRIQSDLEIAREVQNQLYPQHIPETRSLRITASRSPARVVSGDYYDFQNLGDGDVAIAIGDVAGKGISAALLMATIQSSFRMELRSCLTMGDKASRLGLKASSVVGQLNKHLHESTSPEKFATFIFGVFEDESSTFTYSNAGHLPPILVHDGSCRRLEVNGMVVGAFPFAQYGESSTRLCPGDLLVLFTDGISEPENEYGEMFGEERLAELVVRNAHLDDGEIVDEIMNSVRQWTGSDELQDDMTLVLIRRR